MKDLERCRTVQVDCYLAKDTAMREFTIVRQSLEGSRRVKDGSGGSGLNGYKKFWNCWRLEWFGKIEYNPQEDQKRS